MSEFKVGDLVECIDNTNRDHLLTIGKIYRVQKNEHEFCYVFDNERNQTQFFKARFKLAESELKPYDKVRVIGWQGEHTIFEFAQTMAIVADKNGSFHACDIKAMTKVKPKEAPPKFTKVYVWDGYERPENPRVSYSYGKLDANDQIILCHETHRGGAIDDVSGWCRNWEVIE